MHVCRGCKSGCDLAMGHTGSIQSPWVVVHEMLSLVHAEQMLLWGSSGLSGTSYGGCLGMRMRALPLLWSARTASRLDALFVSVHRAMK